MALESDDAEMATTAADVLCAMETLPNDAVAALVNTRIICRCTTAGNLDSTQDARGPPRRGVRNSEAADSIEQDALRTLSFPC